MQEWKEKEDVKKISINKKKSAAQIKTLKADTFWRPHNPNLEYKTKKL